MIAGDCSETTWTAVQSGRAWRVGLSVPGSCALSFLSSLLRLEQRFPVRWPFHLYSLREKAKELADTRERARFTPPEPRPGSRRRPPSWTQRFLSLYAK
jgi:hypothetical protein